MVSTNSGMKMPGHRHCPRIDTVELKVNIEKKLGLHKAGVYFDLLNRYFSGKVMKPEFDKLCIALMGRENICLHNGLVHAIIRNAWVSRTPPPKHSQGKASLNVKVPNGYQRGCLQSLCKDVIPPSHRKGRTPTLRDRKVRDRPSPLGPHGKAHGIGTGCEDSVSKVQEQQSATELQSLGSRPPFEVNSVEEGEEVEQAAGSPGIYSRSPVRAPLGVSLNMKGMKKILRPMPFPYTETCRNTGMLPDMSLLKKKLEQKLETEGLSISSDCINLLNNGLDVFMKRLVKPCLELASMRSDRFTNQVQHQVVSALNGLRPTCYTQKPNISYSASILDFRAAVQLNPRMLGEDWPIQLEKICMRASEESIRG